MSRPEIVLGRLQFGIEHLCPLAHINFGQKAPAEQLRRPTNGTGIVIVNSKRSMLKNHIVSAIRMLNRRKLFSTVNLLGLTVGIASCLVIYLYVRPDFTHDRFHKNDFRIYRVNQTNIWNQEDPRQLARTGPGVREALLAELPEIELLTSIHTAGDYLISTAGIAENTISIDQNNVIAADSNFFKVFSFGILEGDPATCLAQPHSIVLTETAAKTYFGNEDPLGRLMEVGKGNDKQIFKVTGVANDVPENSYIRFNVLLSMSSIPQVKTHNLSWVWTQLETFVLLNQSADTERISERLQSIPRIYGQASIEAATGISVDEHFKSGPWTLFLQPLTRIYLHSDNVVGNYQAVGNIRITYSLVAVALFVVLLSCINFMNLSTAQFTRRVRDASIRKILGMSGTQLRFSYFSEAFVLCLIALITALAVVSGFLPWFSVVSGRDLNLNIGNDIGLVFITLSLLVFMSVFSSSFPSLFLKTSQPVEALNGRLRTGREGKVLRGTFVVVQFTASIVLVICTTFMFLQLKFFSEMNLGFSKENLVVLKHVERVKNGKTLTDDIFAIPGVMDASYCAGLPLHMGSDFFEPDTAATQFILNFAAADNQFLETLNAPLIVGRNFSPDNPADAGNVILNEAAAHFLGWKTDQTILGKRIRYDNENTSFDVIGVVKDFHFSSLESKIEPMAIFNIDAKVWSPNRFVLIRMIPQQTQTWESAINDLKKIWEKHAGDQPFTYEFVDQEFAAKFQRQQQFATVLRTMAVLAILISSLGLLGMVVYSLEQRTKEIGIRKVIGSTTMNIVLLVSRGYTKLILLAFALAAPLSYWLTSIWLRDFANRIPISLSIFVVTGVSVLLFSFSITAYHTIKVARTNPVEILKDE